MAQLKAKCLLPCHKLSIRRWECLSRSCKSHHKRSGLVSHATPTSQVLSAWTTNHSSLRCVTGTTSALLRSILAPSHRSGLVNAKPRGYRCVPGCLPCWTRGLPVLRYPLREHSILKPSSAILFYDHIVTVMPTSWYSLDWQKIFLAKLAVLE
jgi:hypothetical protein